VPTAPAYDLPGRPHLDQHLDVGLVEEPDEARAVGDGDDPAGSHSSGRRAPLDGDAEAPGGQAEDFTVTVTDTATGVVKQYVNPLGQAAAPVQDTFTFAGCS
jgi:hypothetical protein